MECDGACGMQRGQQDGVEGAGGVKGGLAPCGAPTRCLHCRHCRRRGILTVLAPVAWVLASVVSAQLHPEKSPAPIHLSIGSFLETSSWCLIFWYINA